MDDVEFNEDTFTAIKAQPRPANRRGWVARLFIRIGIAHTEKEVDKIMIGFAVIMFLLAASVLWFAAS